MRRPVWAWFFLLVGLATPVGAQDAPTVVRTVEPLLATASAARHAARFEQCDAAVVAHANAVSGGAPSGATALGGQLVRGLDSFGDEPVVEVDGRVLAVEYRLTADGSRVFTVYRLAVNAVLTRDTRLPVAAGQTIVVSRPGGRVLLGSQTAVTVVAGFGTIEVGRRWRPLLVAAHDGDTYHEVRKPIAGIAGLGR